MLNYHLMRTLAPLHFRSDCSEEKCPEYLSRMRREVPDIPQNILQHWIFRHWRGFESNWGWLDLEQIHFEKLCYSTKVLIQELGTHRRDTINYWSRVHQDNSYVRDSWLAQSMLEQGSWPEPIIVLNNNQQLNDPSGRPMAKLHLLEGHHRFAYLKSMYDNSPQLLLPEHEIWLLTPKTKFFM
ncbi:hypothetical protein [Dongshaea marina]|uniref:hypothetical protein n=1 Tax=Dongshaea marina TaxID=2047966 RepID=UPI000D3EA968|nr:hypothetical protein [Dongshaea marina]